MISIDSSSFSLMVEEAWNRLPDYWLDKLIDANISYQVMDYAPRDILRRLSIGNPMGLLGLYTGVPRTSRRGMAPYSWPDRILLFRKPITTRARDIKHLRAIIEHVLYHEIGHYFGMNEEQLHKAQRKSNPFRNRQ
jgi:predicted Zn-dependent protease with MMP-like domain